MKCSLTTGVMIALLASIGLLFANFSVVLRKGEQHGSSWLIPRTRPLLVVVGQGSSSSSSSSGSGERAQSSISRSGNSGKGYSNNETIIGLNATKKNGTVVDYSMYGYPNLPSSESKMELPLPIEVVEEYIKWHGVAALRREWGYMAGYNNDHTEKLTVRKYAIMFYQCPVSAGNRIHEALNDFLYAIISNRTLLWKYYDSEACVGYHERARGKGRSQLDNCTVQGSIEDCSPMLELQNWLPSYDRWARRLGLAASADNSDGHKSTTNPLLYFVDRDELNDMAAYEDEPAVVFYPRTESLDYSNPEVTKLPADSLSTVAAKRLYSWGVPFAYGMAFRYLFDFSERVKSTALSSSLVDDGGNDTFTIAIHSRHTDPREEGCLVDRELNCINDLVPSGQPCRVFLMSDRNCTLVMLRDALESSGRCTVHIANHDKDGGDRRVEHGPFAGLPFFQDLAFTSANARHGVVVGHVPGDKIRTSSSLLRELVEFNRRVEIWQSGEQDLSKVHNTNICKYVEFHTGRQRTVNSYNYLRQESERIQPRAFEVWNQSDNPLPCLDGGLLRNKTESESRSDLRSHQDFIFVDMPQCASAIGYSVTGRIASNVAKIRGFNNSSSCRDSVSNLSRVDGGDDAAWWNSNQSFAWSIVREPASRLASHFLAIEASDSFTQREDFDIQTLKQVLDEDMVSSGSFYVKSLLAATPRTNNRTDFRDVEDIQSILSRYNFLGVYERLDESVVVLQMLLGLNASDVMYLGSSQSSNSRDTWESTTPNKDVLSKVHDFVTSSLYQASFLADELFYKAVNQSLDMTIEKLGRDEFHKNLLLFRKVKADVDEGCLSACDAVSTRNEDNATSCLYEDGGCGLECMASVVDILTGAERVESPH